MTKKNISMLSIIKYGALLQKKKKKKDYLIVFLKYIVCTL